MSSVIFFCHQHCICGWVQFSSFMSADNAVQYKGVKRRKDIILVNRRTDKSTAVSGRSSSFTLKCTHKKEPKEDCDLDGDEGNLHRAEQKKARDKLLIHFQLAHSVAKKMVKCNLSAR